MTNPTAFPASYADCKTDAEMELYLFSDTFKMVHGFRPRGYTVEEALAWLASYVPPTAEENEEENRLMKEENDRMEREMNESYAEWIAEEQQKRDDYGFLPWQVQAGRLRNLPETMILEY